MHVIISAVSALSSDRTFNVTRNVEQMFNLLEVGQRRVRCQTLSESPGTIKAQAIKTKVQGTVHRQALSERANAIRTQLVVGKAEIAVKTSKASKLHCQYIPADSKLDVTRNVGQKWNLLEGGESRVLSQTLRECASAIRTQFVSSKAEIKVKTSKTSKSAISAHSCGQHPRCHQECGTKVELT